MNTLELIYDSLLLTHIIAGCVSLVTGYASLMVKRGGKWHRRAGRIYVYGMTLVVLTAFPIALLFPNPFLFGIAIFSGYFVFSGRSAALNREGNATKMDWFTAELLFLTSVIALGAIAYVKMMDIGYPQVFLIVGFVFSLIGIFISVTDIRKFRAGPIRFASGSLTKETLPLDHHLQTDISFHMGRHLHPRLAGIFHTQATCNRRARRNPSSYSQS